MPADPRAEQPFVLFFSPPEPGSLPGDVIAVFNPSTPDRTEAIQGRAPSPVPWLLESYRLLDLLGARRVGIACNTMHYWYDRQQAAGGHPAFFRLPTVHMIRETARALQGMEVARAGLLATSGTVSAGLYQEAAARLGVRLLAPEGRLPPPGLPPGPPPLADPRRPEEERMLDERGRAQPALYREAGVAAGGPVEAQAFRRLARRLVELLGEQEGLVMEAVYGVMGIKAGSAGGVAERLLREAAGRLVRRGAQALVLGCTEVPLVIRREAERIAGRRVPCLDPTAVLARGLAAEAAAGGTAGIAGGLGPAATIDLLRKMGVEPPALEALEQVHRQTLLRLEERGCPAVRDQDHLKLLFIRAADPDAYRRRLEPLRPWAVAFAGTGGPGAGAWRGLPLRRSVAELVEEGLARKRGEAAFSPPSS